ncbi:MAG TPA: formyltetrahydrofolate deformylase [Opitutaceae bacterium]|jgi:formyltetrahydrofolate deformylase|nr:formyltetrahydrofolate deformylase [Opitutaceae bacterium]
MDSPATLIALLHGPDKPGLVARVAGWIFERGGNILHADQHRDMEAGVFFQRVEWVPCFAPSSQKLRRAGKASAFAKATADKPAGAPADMAQAAEEFRAFATTLGMQARVASSAHRPRVAIFVSKADHCFHDLVLRGQAGEFNGEFALVISNHDDLAGIAGGYDLRFHHIPVAPRTKAAAEASQLELLKKHDIELVILARYMQVLSGEFLQAFARPVINIHHSFLPAFAGGRPYHQAHERGVKIIGATAHYATSDLDDGPIIQQDVAAVTHRHNVDDLVRKGRDLEKRVLAQAVRWHLDNRVLAYGRKTVVFD